MQQVLLNLFMNAIQAMENGGELTAVLSTTADREARIDVKDTGPGIAPEHREQIFDPFFTTKRARGGTGLGLPIAYRIIEEHGGTIGVKSEPGVGTTFTVRIPAREGEGAEETTE